MADDLTVRSELRPASAAAPKLKRFQTVASGAKGAFAEFKKEEEKGRAQTKYAADEFTTEGVGTKAGLYIWRIENLKPVDVQPKDYGKFATGDSYVLLFSKQVKNWLVHDIHFWLGKESTIDETGAAAYKTVELEEKLGGQATQHREVQGHESDKFMSYFPDGVMYTAGGVDSAFIHVDKSNFETRLLHVKGRKNIRSRQVPLMRSSLNDGDVFILDAGSVIYQFNGKAASRAEKAKATKITQNIKDLERSGKARLVILNQDEEDRDNLVDWVAFWDILGGKGPIAPAKDDDEQVEKEIGQEVRLYHVSDAKGSLEINLLPSPISKRQLNSMDAYILDCRSEIFVWIGKGATQLEKNEALAQAKKFLVTHQRPAWTPLTRVLEGTEPVLFVEKFPDWPEATEARARYSQLALLTKLLEESETDKKASAIDVAALIDGAPEGTERLPMDSGSHKLKKKWLIDANGKKFDVPHDDIGKMFESNCYLIDTTYTLKGDERHALYVFYGRRALPADRAAADKKAGKLAKKSKKVGPDCRVIPMEQGRPDSEFVSLFHGALVTFRGEAIPRRRLAFALPYNTKFGETVYVSGSANVLGEWKSEGALRLTWDNGVWRGTVALADSVKSVEYKFFTSDEHGRSQARWETCPNRAVNLKSRPSGITIEIDDTWDNANPSIIREVAPQASSTTQLFHVRGTTLLNTFAAETVPVASSLNSGDSFILRSPTVLFVWFGSGCNAAERKLAHMAARILRPGKEIEAEEFEEGSEPAKFWELLGGKAEYAKPSAIATAPPTRLFHCFNSGGKFQVRELADFGQSDFFEDDVMILDAYSELFVWYGSGANEQERKRSLEVATQYASNVAAQRPDLPDKRVRVVQTFAGAEPPAFLAHFQSWDSDNADPYTKRLRALQKAEADAIQEGKSFIAKTLEYTGELETANAPAQPVAAPAADSAASVAAPAAASSGSSSAAPTAKVGASSDLAQEAAATVAARAAEGGGPRITTAEDTNAGVSSAIAERREAEMREARAAANAAVEAEENAKRAVVAAERAQQAKEAANKIAAWEAGQTGPSAEELRAKQNEERSRARAGSLALSAAEADARRKADQERADAIAARLKAEREAKAAADAKAAAEEAANPKKSIWDRAAEEEAQIQVETRTRLARSVTASQLRAAEAAAAVAAAAAEQNNTPAPAAPVVAAPAPAPEPAPAPVIEAPKPAPVASVDPSSLFGPAVASIREHLAKGQVKLISESIKIIKGQKDFPGTFDTYKSTLGHTRRDIGEAVLQVQETTSSAAFGALRGASADQRAGFGKRLKAFVELSNSLAQGELPYLQTKLQTLPEWVRTDDILLNAIRNAVTTAFGEYEAKIIKFAADQSIAIGEAKPVTLPSADAAPSPASVAAAPSVSAPASQAAAPTQTLIRSESVVHAESARKAAEDEAAKAAEERRMWEAKLKEKREQIALLQARVSSQKLISSPAPPDGPVLSTPAPAPTLAPASQPAAVASPPLTRAVSQKLVSSPAPPTDGPVLSNPSSTAPSSTLSRAVSQKLVSSPAPEPAAAPAAPLAASKSNESATGNFIPYEQLRKDLGGPPRHCDATKLESYLSDAEFRAVFKMDRGAFYAQKDWQIRKAKTAAKLW